MIDLHCHLLPGIDDGPADLAAALDEARVHLAAGVTEVICTPHVSHGYRNTSEEIAEATASLQAELHSHEIALRIRPGAEVSLARAIELEDEELAALHLGGGPFLLLEPPLGGDVPRLVPMIQGIQARGHRILIAHPERCAVFHSGQGPALLAELVEGGALVQLTAGSLSGQFGRTVQKAARSMANGGLLHVVASDAHDARHRPPGLAAEVEAAGLAELIDWACVAMPAAILDGSPLPPRPAVARARRRGLFRR